MIDKTVILHVTNSNDPLKLSRDADKYVIKNMSGVKFVKLVYKTVRTVQEIWDDAEDTDAADMNAYVENAILDFFKLGNRNDRVEKQRAPVMLVIDNSIFEKIEHENILFPTVDSFKTMLEDLDKDQFGAVCYSIYHPDKGEHGFYSMKYQKFRSI